MKVEFDKNSGRFSVSQPETPESFIQGASAWVSYRREGSNKLRWAVFTGQGSTIVGGEQTTDLHGLANTRFIYCPANPDGIELYYHIKEYTQPPFILLAISMRNRGYEPLYLHEFCVLGSTPSGGGRIQLSSPDESVCFFKVGWHAGDYTSLCHPSDRNTRAWIDRLTLVSSNNPMTARLYKRGEFSSEGWGLLIGRDICIVAGFINASQQFGQVYANTRKGKLALSLVTQMDDVRVEPGEQRISELGYMQFVPLPNLEPEANYIEAVARQMGARRSLLPHPVMWSHWYHYFHNITEQYFLDNLQVMTDIQTQVPYRVAELDDGYQPAWGDWTSTNEKFPHGLAQLAQEITAKGLMPGLWLAPFAVQRSSKVARDHTDWLVRNKRGNPAKAGFFYNKFFYALDLSHPAVLEYLQKLIHTLSHEWGYGLLKLDFLGIGALPGRRLNPKKTRAEALRTGLESIRQGAGQETFLLGSGCPFGPAIGIVDAMRIGPDTAPSWEPTLHWLPRANRLIKRHPTLPSLRNNLRHTLHLSSLNNHWWLNDPDCLLMRDKDTYLTEDEVQSAVTLTGLSGGMIASSDDLQHLSSERLSWLSLLIPNLGVGGQALDRFEREMPETYQVKLEGKNLQYQLVALFNWNDEPVDFRLRFSELGYEMGTDLHVFDFWNRRYRCVLDPEMEFKRVPSHGCKLLRVCEVSHTPQFVGDSLHISQGKEIESLQQKNGKLVLKIIDLGRQAKGEIYLWLGQDPQRATCNRKRVPIDDMGEGVYAIRVDFTGKASINIMFSK